jgi:hypothetical protein
MLKRGARCRRFGARPQQRGCRLPWLTRQAVLVTLAPRLRPANQPLFQPSGSPLCLGRVYVTAPGSGRRTARRSPRAPPCGRCARGASTWTRWTRRRRRASRARSRRCSRRGPWRRRAPARPRPRRLRAPAPPARPRARPRLRTTAPRCRRRRSCPRRSALRRRRRRRARAVAMQRWRPPAQHTVTRGHITMLHSAPTHVKAPLEHAALRHNAPPATSFPHAEHTCHPTPHERGPAGLPGHMGWLVRCGSAHHGGRQHKVVLKSLAAALAARAAAGVLERVHRRGERAHLLRICARPMRARHSRAVPARSHALKTGTGRFMARACTSLLRAAQQPLGRCPTTNCRRSSLDASRVRPAALQGPSAAPPAAARRRAAPAHGREWCTQLKRGARARHMRATSRENAVTPLAPCAASSCAAPGPQVRAMRGRPGRQLWWQARLFGLSPAPIPCTLPRADACCMRQMPPLVAPPSTPTACCTSDCEAGVSTDAATTKTKRAFCSGWQGAARTSVTAGWCRVSRRASNVLTSSGGCSTAGAGTYTDGPAAQRRASQDCIGA